MQPAFEPAEARHATADVVLLIKDEESEEETPRAMLVHKSVLCCSQVFERMLTGSFTESVLSPKHVEKSAVLLEGDRTLTPLSKLCEGRHLIRMHHTSAEAVHAFMGALYTGRFFDASVMEDESLVCALINLAGLYDMIPCLTRAVAIALSGQVTSRMYAAMTTLIYDYLGKVSQGDPLMPMLSLMSNQLSRFFCPSFTKPIDYTWLACVGRKAFRALLSNGTVFVSEHRNVKLLARWLALHRPRWEAARARRRDARLHRTGAAGSAGTGARSAPPASVRGEAGGGPLGSGASTSVRRSGATASGVGRQRAGGESGTTSTSRKRSRLQASTSLPRHGAQRQGKRALGARASTGHRAIEEQEQGDRAGSDHDDDGVEWQEEGAAVAGRRHAGDKSEGREYFAPGFLPASRALTLVRPLPQPPRPSSPTSQGSASPTFAHTAEIVDVNGSLSMRTAIRELERSFAAFPHLVKPLLRCLRFTQFSGTELVQHWMGTSLLSMRACRALVGFAVNERSDRLTEPWCKIPKWCKASFRIPPAVGDLDSMMGIVEASYAAQLARRPLKDLEEGMADWGLVSNHPASPSTDSQQVGAAAPGGSEPIGVRVSNDDMLEGMRQLLERITGGAEAHAQAAPNPSSSHNPLRVVVPMSALHGPSGSSGQSGAAIMASGAGTRALHATSATAPASTTVAPLSAVATAVQAALAAASIVAAAAATTTTATSTTPSTTTTTTLTAASRATTTATATTATTATTTTLRPTSATTMPATATAAQASATTATIPSRPADNAITSAAAGTSNAPPIQRHPYAALSRAGCSTCSKRIFKLRNELEIPGGLVEVLCRLPTSEVSAHWEWAPPSLVASSGTPSRRVNLDSGMISYAHTTTPLNDRGVCAVLVRQPGDQASRGSLELGFTIGYGPPTPDTSTSGTSTDGPRSQVRMMPKRPPHRHLALSTQELAKPPAGSHRTAWSTSSRVTAALATTPQRAGPASAEGASGMISGTHRQSHLPVHRHGAAAKVATNEASSGIGTGAAVSTRSVCSTAAGASSTTFVESQPPASTPTTTASSAKQGRGRQRTTQPRASAAAATTTTTTTTVAGVGGTVVNPIAEEQAVPKVSRRAAPPARTTAGRRTSSGAVAGNSTRRARKHAVETKEDVEEQEEKDGSADDAAEHCAGEEEEAEAQEEEEEDAEQEEDEGEEEEHARGVDKRKGKRANRVWSRLDNLFFDGRPTRVAREAGDGEAPAKGSSRSKPRGVNEATPATGSYASRSDGPLSAHATSVGTDSQRDDDDDEDDRSWTSFEAESSSDSDTDEDSHITDDQVEPRKVGGSSSCEQVDRSGGIYMSSTGLMRASGPLHRDMRVLVAGTTDGHEGHTTVVWRGACVFTARDGQSTFLALFSTTGKALLLVQVPGTPRIHLQAHWKDLYTVASQTTLELVGLRNALLGDVRELECSTAASTATQPHRFLEHHVPDRRWLDAHLPIGIDDEDEHDSFEDDETDYDLDEDEGDENEWFDGDEY